LVVADAVLGSTGSNVVELTATLLMSAPGVPGAVTTIVMSGA
jgi:hypothetical protein